MAALGRLVPRSGERLLTGPAWHDHAGGTIDPNVPRGFLPLRDPGSLNGNRGYPRPSSPATTQSDQSFYSCGA